MSEDPFLQRARALDAEWVDLRRDIHRHPELSFQEARTAAKGAAYLEALGLPVERGIAGTHGVVATLDSGRPGPTLLLRGDMDALPLNEETGAEYASAHAGVMHACGHDVHTTLVMGAAKLLSEQREALRGRIKFLLQPAEESPPGGAKLMVEQGNILAGVDAAVAMHVFHDLPAGQFGFRAGPMLAFSDRFTIRILSPGGHAALPHLTVDPVAVAVQVYQALQYLVSRENNPFHPFVITVGAFNAGTAPNIIPDKAELRGTARSMDEAVSRGLPERIETVVAGICQASRAEYRFEYTHGYPALVNDEALTAQAAQSVRALLGDEAAVTIHRAEMGGEDFAFIARAVPATMIRFGIRNEARGIVHPVHNPRFDIDERALPLGVAAMARIAADFVNGGGLPAAHPTS